MSHNLLYYIRIIGLQNKQAIGKFANLRIMLRDLLHHARFLMLCYIFLFIRKFKFEL